ncbi:hypothetical protein SFRURICE_012342 [Spodoptera frugiperda]|nr:hypothetical protein SFRURICE_012342 [Spodoptera frugiperda]
MNFKVQNEQLESKVMIEEAKAINGWERIKDYIRDEKYARSIDDKSASINPLKNITSDELSVLKVSYENYTPYYFPHWQYEWQLRSAT